MTTYAEWAARWPGAAAELNALLVPPVPPVEGASGSEALVQSQTRLAAAARGWRLHRNNVGAATTDTGVFLRFGLANDSRQINERLKSSDLIGWIPTTVTPAMVGTKVAVFASIECKAPGWRMTPGDKRAQAQATWLALVASDGGVARFVTDASAL